MGRWWKAGAASGYSPRGQSGGGGSGAYESIILAVNPGEVLGIRVGAGANKDISNGQATYVTRDSSLPLDSAFLVAQGGKDSQNVNRQNGSGGLGGSITLYSDPLFSLGTRTQTAGNNGNNASNAGPGRGGSAPNGGGMGAEPEDRGSAPGGGGGGAKAYLFGGENKGGDGGDGRVIITYTCPSYSCATIKDDGVTTGTTIIEFTSNCIWFPPEGLAEFEALVVGGGGGGIVHAKAKIQDPTGLPLGSEFRINIGKGGMGGSTTQSSSKGGDGTPSTFDLNGPYQIIAGGGGGGASDLSPRKGSNGGNSSISSNTVGFSASFLRGGSGGGGRKKEAGSAGSGANGGYSGHIGEIDSGGGAGGAAENGRSMAIAVRGGKGGDGLRFSAFDKNRFFSAGGGGGGGLGGPGGSENAGGEGGRTLSQEGKNAKTPGSGGGGSLSDGNSGGNGFNGIIIIRYPNYRILPVEYLYFNAKYNSTARSGDLSWATAKEWENDRFEIERAVNNVKEWKTLVEVPGAGYADKEVKYSYSDMKLPVAGGNIFYRLKQYDFDGNFTYSDTKSIQVEALPGLTRWRVFPNPTTGYPFNIEILDPAHYHDEPITLRIIATTGQDDTLPIHEMRQMGNQVSEWFRNKPAGIYTLEISWGANREYHKVLLN